MTVAIDGVAFPGNGLSHARCLLAKVGMPGVPTSDGDRLRTNNFPDLVRQLLDGVVASAVRPRAADRGFPRASRRRSHDGCGPGRLLDRVRRAHHDRRAGATPGGAFWWDPLAAVAATVRGVETFDRMRISILQRGADEGRTVVDPRGTPVQLGVSASAERFHDVLVDVLNDRRPRR